MTQVALAAGFGSVRRFNATFQKLYGRTPSELRRSTHYTNSRNGGGAAAHYTFHLHYRPPFDWNSLTAFLASRAIPGVETVTPEEYRRNIALDGRAGSIAVRPARAANGLELQIWFPDPATLFRIVERVRRIFDLGADPSEVAGCLGRHASLRTLVRKFPGLRVPGCWDGFELAVRAILGQQVSVKGASTMAGRLAAALGRPAEDGVLFPDAATLADADLGRIGLTRQRAQSIRELAQAVMRGDVVLDGSLEPAEFERRITAVRGIGPWTAQYVAMRLGEPNAFPAGDLYLREFAGRSSAWQPWRAYAAMYLWKGSS